MLLLLAQRALSRTSSSAATFKVHSPCYVRILVNNIIPYRFTRSSPSLLLTFKKNRILTRQYEISSSHIYLNPLFSSNSMWLSVGQHRIFFFFSGTFQARWKPSSISPRIFTRIRRAAKAIQRGGSSSNCSRHVDIKYHHTREQLEVKIT